MTRLECMRDKCPVNGKTVDYRICQYGVVIGAFVSFRLKENPCKYFQRQELIGTVECSNEGAGD